MPLFLLQHRRSVLYKTWTLHSCFSFYTTYTLTSTDGKYTLTECGVVYKIHNSGFTLVTGVLYPGEVRVWRITIWTRMHWRGESLYCINSFLVSCVKLNNINEINLIVYNIILFHRVLQTYFWSIWKKLNYSMWYIMSNADFGSDIEHGFWYTFRLVWCQIF